MLQLLPVPDVQIVSVCDPNQHATGYRDWNQGGILNGIRQTLGDSNWSAGEGVIPGGRDVAKNIVETYYANKRAADKYKGCSSYADFRELLEKEKDLNAVKIMTPDHLHGVISMAAMKKNKHVIMHKPIANRLDEARLVIDTARQTGVATHFVPWDPNGSMETVLAWVKDGAIGTLREVHNWSNRPVWPQYATIPTDRPTIPEGFDWSLWLGPSLDRPYHPNYTHAVFRGWYEFGGGALADIGHYSLWPVFRLFDLDSPFAVESRPSHVCALTGGVPVKIKNDYSFPAACTIRFRF